MKRWLADLRARRTRARWPYLQLQIILAEPRSLIGFAVLRRLKLRSPMAVCGWQRGTAVSQLRTVGVWRTVPG